jgi:hypothetical protein
MLFVQVNRLGSDMPFLVEQIGDGIYGGFLRRGGV